jgi:lipopolysaccharide transport system ATP-binding protein
MFVRLAFAVAAHLDPEILIVDEVLAVGDSTFQRKCLGKMSDVAREGRTILFVSHNMAAVQQLATHGVVLNKGRIVFNGTISEAVSHYIKQTEQPLKHRLKDRLDRQGNGRLRFTHIEIENEKGMPVERVLTGMDITIRLHYEASESIPDATVDVAFNLSNSLGLVITNLNSSDTGLHRAPIYKKGSFICRWPKFGLKTGTYKGALFCSINGEIADWMQNAIEINVETGDYFGSGKIIGRSQGDVLFMHKWESESSL